MEKWLLIKFEKNWADEFDCQGLTIITEKEWELHKFKAKYCVTYPIESFFGTNEGWEYKSFSEYIKSFKVEVITDDQALFINKLFDLNGFFRGYGIIVDIDEGNMDDEFFTKDGDFIGIEAAKNIIKDR